MKTQFYPLLFLLVLLQSCETKEVEKKWTGDNVLKTAVFQGISLLGDSLITDVDTVAQQDQLKKLFEAERAYAEEPSLDNLIWIGRREAYLGRYDLAIRTFTKGIEENKNAFEPLRHRGHRFISTRELDRAIEDLEKAADLMQGQALQIEKDGMPNAFNIPLSNVQFNVWYHLGLAHYLKGDFESALKAYQSCLTVSNNDDLLIATLDWYYMALMKLGKTEEAQSVIKPVHEKMTVLENDDYLKRILMYKGILVPEDLLKADVNLENQRLQYVTQGYGLGNHYLSLGDTSKAKIIFENVVASGFWSAFGYIGSEMELTKLRNE
ncbi:tetratricopeptide repeat protein [Rhodonellum sp.]|uniref:tetratricopeptide repeat protein n=1 Tax=Rhodonellum sp. TaxID=2231180 RepID=UPI00271AF3C2|nr:tetratricopeptide repeat protein [Rhodonellum sp.]MDO9552300.1 tetratricopeptide repeat protein [Rhodonellum sp.]